MSILLTLNQNYTNVLRMDNSTFMKILEKFEPFIKKIDTKWEFLFLQIKDCKLLRDINLRCFLATGQSIITTHSHSWLSISLSDKKN